jgi:hypothetical protein
MFTNQDIIAIVFRLINFTALLGVSLYLFKKHVMPDLLMDIENKKEAENSLFLQQGLLEKQQLNLDILLKEDALQCEKFRLKIDEWKKVVTADYEYREKEHNNMMTIVNKRIAHNAVQREQSRIQNIVTHAVVIDLEKSLSLHFHDSKESSEYLNSILHFMNEKLS